MNISLTDKESQIFYETIDAEHHCVINEYDYSTCRCPGKKRREGVAKYARPIIDKWEKTQKFTPGMNFIDLENIKACNLDLTAEEIKYSKELLDREAKGLRKELNKVSKPYTGAYQLYDDTAVIIEGIIARI